MPLETSPNRRTIPENAMKAASLIFALAGLFLLAQRSLAADAADTAPNTLTDEEKQAGFKLLFDGKTTKGWRGYNMKQMPPGWKVLDGVLTKVAAGAGGKGAGGGDDIITEDKYDNFELRLQWRVGKGVNSGILYRAVEGAVTSWHVAPEMQVLDNVGWGEPNEPRHHAAALYDLYKPTKDTSLGADKWHDVKLIANGNHIEHWLNGEKVVECELNSDDWNERVSKSKFKDKPEFAKAAKGHICLQDHSGRVEYRSIRLRELKGKE
jgi:alpha-3'-ketoglucosidase